MNNDPSQHLGEHNVAPVDSATERFNLCIANLADQLPELVEKPEIVSAGRELIEHFSIKSEFFDVSERSILFSAIAAKWAETLIEERAEGTNGFVMDALTLVAGEYSDDLQPHFDYAKDQEGRPNEVEREKVYDRFTNHELSQAVVEAINNGFLDDTKRKLGINAENEQPYTIRVLNIGDDFDLNGIDAPRPNYSLDHNSDEYQAQLKAFDETRQWKQSLLDQTKQFVQELYDAGDKNGGFAPAWKTEVNGEVTLCISAALALKVVSSELTKNVDWYGEDDLNRDTAILSHEYTHSQGGLSSGENWLGINIEELRAEHFSGNKHGYQDIKSFFSDYMILTGHNIISEMESAEKGGVASQVYASIAERVGLSTMLDVLLASPKNYIEAQNECSKRLFKAIGGYDGVLNKIRDNERASGRESEIEQRIAASAQRIVEREQAQPGSTDVWLTHRKRLGVTVVAQDIERRLSLT